MDISFSKSLVRVNSWSNAEALFGCPTVIAAVPTNIYFLLYNPCSERRRTGSAGWNFRGESIRPGRDIKLECLIPQGPQGYRGKPDIPRPTLPHSRPANL
jgi:hypothetical protein